MEFLKKHYEKLILSIVLLGLAVAAALLPFALKKAQEDLQATEQKLPTPKPVKPVNLSTNEQIIAKLKNPPPIELSGQHNLFNPVVWKQFPDGTLKKIPTSNPAELLQITSINPLRLIVAYDRATGSGYYFSMIREAWVPRSAAKARTSRYLKKNEKAALMGLDGKMVDIFVLVDVVGPADDPTEFVVELADTKELAHVTKEKFYSRVEGYAADLKYELANRTFPDTRVGASLAFEGDTYNVIAILKNEVRVQAFSNQKITTVTWKGAE
jgi:hypothetical protein